MVMHNILIATYFMVHSSHLLQWSRVITVQHRRITHAIPRQTEL